MSYIDEGEARADRAIANAFGRLTPAAEDLIRDLVEAGVTPGAAGGVLRWVQDGASASEAVTLGVGWNGVEPGKVRELVQERATAIVARHQPTFGATDVAGRPVAESSGSSSALEAAREDLVQANIARDRKYVTAAEDARRRIAEAATKGRVDAIMEWAVREGWSQEQVLAKIREAARQVRGNAAPAQLSPGDPAGGQQGARIREVTEADADKAIAGAFGRQI